LYHLDNNTNSISDITPSIMRWEEICVRTYIHIEYN
jgi:hypothetical protein